MPRSPTGSEKPVGLAGGWRRLPLATWIASPVVALAGIVILSAFGIGPAEASHAMPAVPVLAAVCLVAGWVFRAPDPFALRLVGFGSVGACALALMASDLRNAVAPWFAPSANAPITLVELNVWDLNRDPARTIAWLKATRADIIVVSEANEAFVGDLVHALPDYPTAITCTVRAYCGVAIFSRFKGRLVPQGAWISSGLRHVAPVDPGMALAAVELRIPRPDGRETLAPVVAVHIDRKGASRVTSAQVETLKGLVRSASARSPETLLLVGDFNSSPWAPQLRGFEASIRATRQSAFAPSWPAGWRIGGIPFPPVLAIDHTYLGCRWQGRGVRVGSEVRSDHRPLLTRFAWSSKATAACPDASPSGGGEGADDVVREVG